MKKLCIILAGLFACTCMTTAWAGDSGFSADQIAENQGAVAYWYAVGYSYVNGQAGNWADVEAIGAPLRGFYSPHTGDAVTFDDDLNGEGDMMYVAGDWGPEIHVRLSTGDIVLPGTLTNSYDCGDPCDPCGPETCSTCCDISICDVECWDVCDNNEAVCKIVEWMMWKSFETFECRYDRRPCGEEEWFASGFSPIDANWREKAPYMDIEYVWKSGDACTCACILKKAYVSCCPPAPVCDPCATKCKPTCEDKCNKCEPKCKTNTCSKSKCDNKCGKPKCDNKCAKPKCESKCKPKCENKCKPKCESKCKTNTCNKCVKPCDNKCGKPKCDNKCAKPKCESKCKPKCENKCKPKCESKCKTNTCNKCVKPCDNKCGKPKCDNKCKPKCESKCKPKCESKCKPACESKCKPKCESKCKTNACTKCVKPCDNKCGKSKCGKCG